MISVAQKEAAKIWSSPGAWARYSAVGRSGPNGMVSLCTLFANGRLAARRGLRFRESRAAGPDIPRAGRCVGLGDSLPGSP